MLLVPMTLITGKVSQDVIHEILHNAGIQSISPTIPPNVFVSTDASWSSHMDTLVGRSSTICSALVDGKLKPIGSSHDIEILCGRKQKTKLVVYRVCGRVIIWHYLMSALAEVIFTTYMETLETVTDIINSSIRPIEKCELLSNRWGGVWAMTPVNTNGRANGRPNQCIGIHGELHKLYTTSPIVRMATELQTLEVMHLEYDTPAYKCVFEIDGE